MPSRPSPRASSAPLSPFALLGPSPARRERGMTAFAARVLTVVRAIPSGRVATYGDVARLAGRPGAARAVGNIMRHCSDPAVPAHRVTAAGGRLGGYGGSEHIKRERLAAEGIRFRGGRLREFSTVRWTGPSRDAAERGRNAAAARKTPRKPSSHGATSATSRHVGSPGAGKAVDRSSRARGPAAAPKAVGKDSRKRAVAGARTRNASGKASSQASPAASGSGARRAPAARRTAARAKRR